MRPCGSLWKSWAKGSGSGLINKRHDKRMAFYQRKMHFTMAHCLFNRLTHLLLILQIVKWLIGPVFKMTIEKQDRDN
jgi:hypothetical protein